jgi:pyrroline-5-carboxylate reductase
MSSISILGCGNIGLSLAEGFLLNDSVQHKLHVTRRNPEPLLSLKLKGVAVGSDNKEAVSNSDFVILAVKPYKVLELLEEIKPALRSDHILVSVASEISIAEIQKSVGTDIPVVRVMPNTASSIGDSITCISASGKGTTKVKEVEKIFKGIGETVIIDENLMEAATILGACGIAYVLRFIRAMVQGGIQIGFDAKTAALIANQTVKGAAELLLKNGSHPEQEIDKVTTPKGCTITGLNEMEHQGFSSSLIHGIVKSFEKIEK